MKIDYDIILEVKPYFAGIAWSGLTSKMLWKHIGRNVYRSLQG